MNQSSSGPGAPAAAVAGPLCLICLSPSTGDIRSLVSRVFEEEVTTWNKLCAYWLFPSRNFKKALEVCSDHHLCKGCANSVKEVQKIQAQIEALEDRIKKRAHEMARLITESTKIMEDSPTRKLKAEDVWLKFKEPVIHNYTTYTKPPPPPKPPTTITTTLPTTAIITYEVSNQEYYQEVEIHLESTTTVPADESSESEEDDDNYPGSNNNPRRLPPFGTIECPKCDFSVPFDEKSNAGAAYQTRCNARNKINSHYTANHNPVKRSDISTESVGEEEEDRFYQCTLCPFKSFIRNSPSSSYARRQVARENDALNSLSRHYIYTHDNSNAANEEGNQDEPLVEGVDIFTCPVEGCGFASKIPECSTKAPNKKVENKRPALCKLGTHYLRTHEFPRSKILGRHPCLEIIAGKEGFKCPRCEFRTEVNLIPASISKTNKKGRILSDPAGNKRRVASMSFMRHFVTHVYPM